MRKSDFCLFFFVQLNICTVACLENSYTIHNFFTLHGHYIFSYFNTSVKNSSLSLTFKLRNQLKRAETVCQVEMSRGQEKRDGVLKETVFKMCECLKEKKTKVFSFSLMMYICSFFAICVFICKYRKINKNLHTIDFNPLSDVF